MCGIAGIISQTATEQLETLNKMTDLIKHRGPDDEGFACFNAREVHFWGGESTKFENTDFSYFPTQKLAKSDHQLKSKIAFGHRRLSIIDLSPAGHQPMSYNNGKLWIIYNGEIYNYIELREELKKNNYKFQTESDTEVVLAAYQEYGKACLDKFNGMFSFAIYDIENKIVFCARDRFGIKPFYYTEKNGSFYFASEIKQFTAIPSWKSVLNKKIAADFLILGLANHSRETFFEDVVELKGGETLIYNLETNDYSVQIWYDLEKKTKKYTKSFDEAKKQFNYLFHDSVKFRLRSDVKVGSCLSGGLDSSAIVGSINAQLREQKQQDKQETVSSCFEDKEFDEQEYIDEVVKKTEVKAHKLFPQFDKLFEDLPKLVWHQDEPFGSTSIYAQWNVFKTASEKGLTVMLDGQGADEQLGGYPNFYGLYLVSLLRRFKILKYIKEQYHFYQKQRVFYIQGKKFSIILLSVLPLRLRNILKKFESNLNPDWLKVKNETLLNIPKNIQILSIYQINRDNLPALLRYEDRNSMAFSIESRIPFLDYRLLEFNVNIPEQYKLYNGASKYILRESMKDVLPEKVYNRHRKLGFATPEKKWFKEHSVKLREILSEACETLEEFVHKDKVLEMYDKEVGHIKLGSVYWRIICMHYWAKVFEIFLSYNIQNNEI